MILARSRVQVTKKHKVIYFSQRLWLKPYIGFNTQKRAQVKQEFEKSYVQLTHNSVFGKCIENVKKYEPDHGRANSSRMCFQNTFKGARYIDGLYMVGFHKQEIKYSRPIYGGTSILDLSKLTMMKFH